VNIVDSHFKTILENYTKGDYYDLLKTAKDQYVELTGKMDEDSHEYESRMSTFNDWFIFNFRREDGRRVIDDYLEDHELEVDIEKSFHNTTYSVFEFSKVNFKKQVVLKDILHGKKIILSSENSKVALLVEDIFIGRVVSHNGENYLLRGICSLPRDILSILKKESKRIRKLNNEITEEEFLLSIEKLKTKSIHYGHLNTQQVFVFG